MKILIVDRAGAFSIWTLMNAVADAALARGDEVVCCLLDNGAAGTPPPPPGVRIERIAIRPGKALSARVGQWFVFAWAFVALLRRERPDVVHTNFCVPGLAARLIARLMGVPRIASTYHEIRGSINPLYRLGLDLTAWAADVHIYVSTACARSFGVAAPTVLTMASAASNARHVVLRNGLPPFSPPPKTKPDADASLVVAGRLMPEKGVGALIDAVALLRESGDARRLLVLGDGPARHALEAQVRALGLAGHVGFAGWTPHDRVVVEIGRAACVVVPGGGRGEGFGMALAEALAAGRRIVASDIPVFHEVVEGLETGVTFFSQGDPTALATALRTALARPLDEDAIRRRQAQARERFDIARMAALYLDLYDAAERRRSR